MWRGAASLKVPGPRPAAWVAAEATGPSSRARVSGPSVVRAGGAVGSPPGPGDWISGAAVTVASPRASRQAGQRPWAASTGRVAPHVGQVVAPAIGSPSHAGISIGPFPTAPTSDRGPSGPVVRHTIQPQGEDRRPTEVTSTDDSL